MIAKQSKAKQSKMGGGIRREKIKRKYKKINKKKRELKRAGG